MTFTTADLSSVRPEDPVVGTTGPVAVRPGHATRRVFSPAYKLRIVTEYDSLTGYGARGALLRREGLYQSHIDKWRRARDRGSLTQAGATAKEGPSAESRENRRLLEENARLTAELDKANAVVEILGKVCALLEALSGSAEQPTRPTRSSTGR